MKHKVKTPYHPQTSAKVEVSHRVIKSILEKTMSANRTDWARTLDDYGPIGQHIRLPQVHIYINLFMENHASFLLNLSISHYRH